MKFLFLFLPLLAAAQITGVRIEASNTQAIIHYTAPSAAACTIKVWDMNLPIYISNAEQVADVVTIDTRGLAHGLAVGQSVYIDGTGLWDDEFIVASVPSQTQFTIESSQAGTATVGTVGTLVNDVNTALFAGSNSDSRSGNLLNGRERVFIVGTKGVGTVNGVNYSRALQANSLHRYILNCGSVASGYFRTANIALGQLAIDVPKPASPGGSAWPSLNKQGRWETGAGAWLDRVIDPVTGVLYTNIYPPEYIYTSAFGLSTSNTPVPTGTNWTNPGNVRTQDGASATYSAATQDVLCIRPYLIMLPVSYLTVGNWGTQNVSLENIVATVRGSGAGSGDDGDVEIAYTINGCVTAATDWKIIDLTGGLTSVSFPSGTPQAAFGDWHSGSQRRLNHIDVVTRRGTVNTSGTAVTVAEHASWKARFDNINWASGSKVRIIGGTVPAFNSLTALDPTTCDDGTEYDIASVEHPSAMTLQSSAGTQSAAWYCAQNFGVMIRKKTTSTDQINIDYVDLSIRQGHIPTSQASGSAKVFGENPIADSDGNLGYVTHIAGQGGSYTTMHWVSKDTGESRYIMSYGASGADAFPAVAGDDGWLTHNCGATENTFGATDPSKFYCLATGNSGGQVLIEYTIHWDGVGRWRSRTPSGNPIPVCTTTSPASPNPCLAARNMHAGYSLTELLQDRNPDFDPAKYTTMSIRGIQGHIAVLFAYRSNQDTAAWFAAFDLDVDIASYDPMDQSTNPVKGAISTMHPSLRGLSVLHSAATLPGSSQYIIMNPKFGRRTNNTPDINGAGPWRMDIVGDAALNNTTDIFPCPANQWNYVDCSTIHITSDPFDPDPGVGETGAVGEYRGNAIGDGLRFWKCDSGAVGYTHETIQDLATSGCMTYASEEWGRILAISGTAPDITLTVARGIHSTFPKRNHVSGYKIYSWAITDQNVLTGNVLLMWDFINSPTGTPESGVAYVSQDTAHMAATSKQMTGGSGVVGYNQVTWKNPTIANVQQPPPVNLALPVIGWPPQFGKVGMRYANTIQQYKANNHIDYPEERETAYQFYVDSRPFINTPSTLEQHLFEKIGGATYLYKYKGHQDLSTQYPYFKHIPMYLTSGYKTLTEKSGVSVTLADNSGDHWKFCVAYQADECATGSVYGDIYANVPYATPTISTDYGCLGANHGPWNEADICAMKLDPMTGPNIQFYFGNSNNLGRGRHLRKLGWGLQEAPKLYGQVPKVGPDGEWLGPLWTNYLNAHRSGALMMKLPPIPAEDGYDRTTFVPVPVSAGSVPAGTAVAQVEFGYHDFGTPAQFYCTARQESCLATNSKVIGDGLVSNVYSNSNPAAAYPTTGVTVSSTTPIRLTYPSAHKLTGDVKVKVTLSTSSNNNRLWPISIVDADEIDLVGSTSGQVTSGSQSVLVPVLESPFAFSGESFSVAGATNASPIEITTTTMHRFSTGANVCLSGVGGNTATNGCWTIIATGPSSFTLTGATGNGTYTSGGAMTPGGVACTTGCTVVIPGLTKHVLFYRWRYLNSTGTLLSVGNTQALVVP